MRFTLLICLLLLPLALQMAVAVRPRPNNVGTTPRPSTGRPVDRFRRHPKSSSSHQMPTPLEDPDLPDVPPALKNVQEDCLFWQYIQAKPLTQHEVQEQIQDLCVNNRTSNPQSQNGWCEIDLEVVIREINGAGAGAALRMDSGVTDSVKQLHIYIHFTQSGLWQVLAMPDCPRGEQDGKRFVRSLFNKF